jgi:hypothetical protein
MENDTGVAGSSTGECGIFPSDGLGFFKVESPSKLAKAAADTYAGEVVSALQNVAGLARGALAALVSVISYAGGWNGGCGRNADGTITELLMERSARFRLLTQKRMPKQRRTPTAATTDPAIIPRLPDAAPPDTAPAAGLDVAVFVKGVDEVVDKESAIAVLDTGIRVDVDGGGVLERALVCSGRSDVYTAWFFPITQRGAAPDGYTHSYPKGQHVESPHDGRSESNAVVRIGPPGWLVTFISPTLHVVGVIVLQFWPLGQQSAVVLDASTTHLVSGEQQKLTGRPWPHAL